ncbi:hypothetical protein SAMN04488556_1947 [Halostagnicola kamekurae]|uniref:Uncharacterized protein n=1 Tax=Halostagnicola kamekurae TaxID=619731 RepID=A0A1I6RP14_9EURY|nr:hypothetical protein SAMN04488556_1947 [Halostagnicola kamekurae]
MTNWVNSMTQHKRIVGVCECCGSVYAAKVLSSGRIRPIGRDQCSCGSKGFQPLE